VVPEEVYKTGKNGQIGQNAQKRTKTAILENQEDGARIFKV
jgi:hypothetical protein